FPLFERASAFCCTLNPGELLLIPSRWWHHVSTVQKSITVAYTFFNRTNFPQYFTSLFKHLPQILDEFSRIPGWQEQLGVKWASRDFEFNEPGPGGDNAPPGNGSS